MTGEDDGKLKRQLREREVKRYGAASESHRDDRVTADCLFAAQPALAQKSGGVLKISFFDNPASMSRTKKRPARRSGR
jgi:hypothetical protein